MSIETIIQSMRKKSDLLRIAHDDRMADVITVYADDLQKEVDELHGSITTIMTALHNEITPP